MWTTTFISTARKHLSVLTKDNKWYTYSFTNPVILTDRDAVDKLVIDSRDTKWFAVTDGRIGLYYYNENSTFENTSDDKQGYISTSDGLLSNVISSLAVDLRGQLWIGTSQGLSVINNTTLTGSTSPRVSSNIATAIRGQTVNCIAVDPLDQKWVGTNQGLFVLSSDGILLKAHYNSSNSPIPFDEVKSLAIDGKTGKVYIGTDFGLGVLQTSSIEPKENFEEVFVYPNPYVVGNNSNINLTIEGLIRNSNLKIFDIAGKLIKDFVSPGGMVAFWDGRDLDGRLVPSGVYVIVAYDSEANNVATAKVAVIRK
jgi:ligand-binding sensor domain-containing protein